MHKIYQGFPFAGILSVFQKHGIYMAIHEAEIIKNESTEYFSVVQKEAKGQVKRNIRYYNLDAIKSLGYRANSKRETRFRI